MSINIQFNNDFPEHMKDFVRTEVYNTVYGVPRYLGNDDKYFSPDYKLPCGKWVTSIKFRNEFRDVYCIIK